MMLSRVYLFGFVVAKRKEKTVVVICVYVSVFKEK